ncbi:MAG: acyl-CoA desaturase [Spirulinaceae cyanobacterium RM2_2_10]|nr:acyl-CoA desaturase [Spirulinaceae cyanobacterium SM2_1_0]NJO21252.1 acyl-CoA desaturase [Spirulinaceae cyanobacterium RM2_2_10]
MTAATSNQDLPFNWVNTVYLVLTHTAVLAVFLPGTFSWSAVGVAVFLHWVTGGLGITLGLHRLAAHRSFETPKWLEYFFILCAGLACQGGVIDWVGLHRQHHKFSDTGQDPHDSNEGFYWSHWGWMMRCIPGNAEIPRYTQDIANDPFYKFVQNYFVPLQIALGLILFALGGWPFIVWGVFVRLVAVFHCTWFVNSATHKFGYRTFESEDRSRNCWWVALITYGEGWHNNHHAYQYSARHGLRWWEVDATWMTIWLLQQLGLARKVKLAAAPSK